MSSFRIGNKHYKIIPFLITTGTLLFFVFWIGGISYKYHLETEERRKLQEVDIKAKARELNNDLHNENKKLKKENEYMKDTPYEFQRENGEKEYYNLFTHKLVKKIDSDNNVFEYDKNNGLLLKKTDRYNNVEEYGLHGKLIKKTLSDGVWMEYNPVNAKMMKRKNIDGSIEEFDDNEEKFKEIDKNNKVKFFKTKFYKTVQDFEKLFINNKDLEKTFLESRIFNLEELKASGYTAEELKASGYTAEELKDAGFKNIEKIYYQNDGKTIECIEEYNFDGKRIKSTNYQDDGKTIKSIYDYDLLNGKTIKETYYQNDGKTIKSIYDYSLGTQNRFKTTYNQDGTIKEKTSF
ncbi:DUF2963 domain-containing protein [Chrysanthemum yellows phytoplasma]|uniref:DUF2963 domain-containing protein n=1 Tax=Chrysanthemum yellows phytoplasma TaxID=238674 RepID=UPI00054CBB9A|nr:DUF2963 domain-containing protein [Chrysanthemum yellows phytoplasma]